MSKGIITTRLVLGLGLATMAACASAPAKPGAAPAAAPGAAPGTHAVTYQGQIGFDDLAARAVVPARMADLPTAVVASHALAAPGWPVANLYADRGILLSQWMSFSVTGYGQGASGCWIDVRLGVRPIKDDPANVELLAQLWLQGRFGTDPALRLARLALEAFRADILTQAQTGKVDHGRVEGLLDYGHATPSEYTYCGPHPHG